MPPVAPADWDAQPIMLSAAEAAQIMRCDVKIVRELSRGRNFPSVKLGRAIRISRDGLRAWLARETGQALEQKTG